MFLRSEKPEPFQDERNAAPQLVVAELASAISPSSSAISLSFHSASRDAER